MPLPTHLHHYYHRPNGPFRNLTAHPKHLAQSIQQQITEGFNSQRPDNYVDLRFALEARLHAQFIQKGGKPTRKDPFYFTLGPCDWAKTWYPEPAVIKISLADIPPEHLSFTYPDSMVSFQLFDTPKLTKYCKPANGKVFLLDELPALIEAYGIPSEAKWTTDEAFEHDRYIEAQLWDDAVIREFLRS